MIEAKTLTEAAGDMVKEAVKEHLTETWSFMKEDLIHTAGAFVLIGGTICIILYVAGWEKGMRYTGIIFAGYLLFRALLG
jgi:hypothetical protein